MSILYQTFAHFPQSRQLIGRRTLFISVLILVIGLTVAQKLDILKVFLNLRKVIVEIILLSVSIVCKKLAVRQGQ